jgi:HEPN domain-containing protein
MKKLTEEWLRAAKDDLDVMEKILGEAHLSHITAFHAQQCIEKVFKAVYEEHGI